MAIDFVGIARRVKDAEAVLELYADRKAEKRVVLNGAQELVTDLLADLMHFCDARGLEFQYSLEWAGKHWEAETTGQ